MFEKSFQDNLKSRLEEALSLVTQKNRERKWICPLCNSGGKRNKTSAFSVKEDVWFCHACGKGGNIFNLIAALENLDVKNDFMLAIGKTCELLGEPLPEDSLSISAGYSSVRPSGSSRNRFESNSAAIYRKKEETPSAGFKSAGNDIQEKTNREELKMGYGKFIDDCANSLKNSSPALKYLRDRGISDETMNRFRLGFEEARYFPGANRELPAIVIPYDQDDSYFIARSLEEKYFSKPRRDEAGQEPIFNLEALYNAEKSPVFVVEGSFDAISVEQLGFKAIALMGMGRNKLIDQLKERSTESVLIIAADNDETGKKTAESLSKDLSEIGALHAVENLTESLACKDANEALIKDSDAFSKVLQNSALLSELKAISPDNDSLYVENSFYRDRDNFRNNKNVSSGFSLLDYRLGGGIYPGLYVIGAATSLGKTTFCHQMACHMAGTGTRALFFSLEMSKFEMVSRGIARTIAKSKKADEEKIVSLSSFDVRKGELTAEIEAGAKKYGEYVKGKLSVVQCEFGCTVEKIQSYVEDFIAKNKDERPVVFIDYLQVLKKEKNEKFTKREEIDEIVTSLKLFSSEYKVPVFAVSSINRGNYILPISFESFKESGGIEYTADVVLGLQLACLDEKTFDEESKKIGEKRKKIRESMSENPRKIKLLILKNRFGISTGSLLYDYYCNCDLFCNENCEEELKNASHMRSV